MYKICVYVPPSHLEAIKNALFSAGAGRIGKYQNCSWQILGEGQFKPTANAQPYLGTVNQLATVQEYRVEMVCAARYIRAAITALVAAHPYEQPAYDCWKVAKIETTHEAVETHATTPNQNT